MARWMLLLLGIVILGLGAWAAMVWSREVLIALKALVTLFALILGMSLIIFGISEIVGARAPAPPAREE